MKEPGLDGRHRTLLGRISAKHGNTLVATVRRHYGAASVPAEFPDTDDLKDVLHKMNEPSLSKLLQHYPG